MDIELTQCTLYARPSCFGQQSRPLLNVLNLRYLTQLNILPVIDKIKQRSSN